MGKHRSNKTKTKSRREVKDLKKKVKQLKQKISRRERNSSSEDSRDSSASSSRSFSRHSSSSSASRSRSPRPRRYYSSYSRSRSYSYSGSSVTSAHSNNNPENAKNDKDPQLPPTNSTHVDASVTKDKAIDNNPKTNGNETTDGKVVTDKLDILGEDPTAKDLKVTKLHLDVVSRWKYWLVSGITEQTKEDLLKQYPRKGDCLLEPPELNPEIKIPKNDIAKKRDDHFQDLQRLNGSALAALGIAISNLLGEEQLEPLQDLQLLSDAGKILTELFHSISVARLEFITPGYSKTIREILNTSTDNQTFLFSEKLNEKVNEAKTFEKLNQDMKNTHGPGNSFQRPASSLNYRSSSLRRPETSRIPVKKEFLRK